MADAEEPLAYDCVVLGAGISGLAAARKLAEANWRVLLVEKSRGVGGRLATRRIQGEHFDSGAQFFTTRGSELRSQCDLWQREGVVDRWFGSGGKERFKGKLSMNAIAKHLASGLEVRREFLVRSLRPHAFGLALECQGNDAVVAKRALVTCPAPQALQLLETSRLDLEPKLIDALKSVEYSKCVALLALLDRPSGLPRPGYLKRERDDVFDTIVDVQQKGTSGRPGIVAHACPSFAERHYDQDKDWLTRELVRALRERFHVEPIETYLHKWRYAMRLSEWPGEAFLSSGRFPIWFAGDSYSPQRVEGAYESGIAAARDMLAAEEWVLPT